MIEMSPNKRANQLAVLAIVGLALATVLIIHAGGRVAATPGLSALHVSPQGEILFAAASSLYRIDGRGRLLAKYSVDDLSIAGRVSSQAVDSQGRWWLLDDQGTLYLCATGGCSHQADLPVAGHALSLVVDEVYERLLVADSSGHSVMDYRIDSGRILDLELDHQLRYPNDLALLDDARLLVTDTNRHRLLLLHEEDAGVWRSEAQTAITGKRNWPIAARRDAEGYTWVIQANGMLKKGEVYLYLPGADEGHRVALDLDDPVKLALLDGAPLVADFGYRLLLIDPYDYSTRELAEGAVQEDLAALRTQRQAWQMLQQLGIALVVAMLGLGLAAVLLDRRARAALPASSGASGSVDRTSAEGGGLDNGDGLAQRAARLGLRPDHRGVVWVAVNEEFMGNMRRMPWLGALALVLGFGLFIGVLGVSLPFALLAPVLLMYLISWAATKGLSRMAVGTDGRQLYMVDPFGRTASGYPSSFRIAGRRLLQGKASIPLNNDFAMVFNHRQMKEIIEPMLEECPRISGLAMLRLQLGEGDLLSWLSVVMIVLGSPLLVWIWFA